MSAASSEAEGTGDLLDQLAHQIHEICQPLTALMCRLEIEQMEREGKPPGSIDRTLTECVGECERLNGRVHAMRLLVRGALDARRNQEEETEA